MKTNPKKYFSVSVYNGAIFAEHDNLTDALAWARRAGAHMRVHYGDRAEVELEGYEKSWDNTGKEL